MNTSPSGNEALLVELLRSQEAMRLELRRLSNLYEAQARELVAMKTMLYGEAQQTPQSSPPSPDNCLTLSAGLLTPHVTGLGINPKQAVWRDLSGLFSPAPNTLLPRAAFILYRQLQALNTAVPQIAVITTPRTRFEDILAVARCDAATELRLHDINGPVEVVTHSHDAPPTTHWLPVGLQALPWAMQTCDLLWIPDPCLASLLLQCRAAAEGLAERVRRSVLLTLNAEHWLEDEARRILHGGGFIEVSRAFEADSNAYVTRMHESQGCYPLTAVPPAVTAGPLYLLASKIPTPSFRIHCSDEADNASP